MAFDYLNEAFKKLSILEDMFDSSTDGINELNSFMQDDDSYPVRVIDDNADTVDELEDSYVGKVIIKCNVCHSNVFKDKEEIEIDENGLANSETNCPYCGEQEGFTIVGEIAPFNGANDSEEETTETEEENNVSDSDVDLNTDDDIQESADSEINKYSEASRRATLTEEIKEMSFTTDYEKVAMTSDNSGKVTITTEPVENISEGAEEDVKNVLSTEDETIVPVSDETANEILTNNDISTDDYSEQPEEETEGEEQDELETEDIEIDEVDEEGLSDVTESYLREVYDNVDSFKCTDISSTDTKMIVEGLIKFKSGEQKKTGFIFEAKDINSKGKVRFVGYNNHLSTSNEAFSLVGTIDNKKLFTESLKYNYHVNESLVRGLARRK